MKGVDSPCPAVNQGNIFLPVYSYIGSIRTNECNLEHIYKKNMKQAYFSSHVSAERKDGKMEKRKQNSEAMDIRNLNSQLEHAFNAIHCLLLFL